MVVRASYCETLRLRPRRAGVHKAPPPSPANRAVVGQVRAREASHQEVMACN